MVVADFDIFEDCECVVGEYCAGEVESEQDRCHGDDEGYTLEQKALDTLPLKRGQVLEREQRRRDEAYNAAVRQRDELRRQLQHLD